MPVWGFIYFQDGVSSVIEHLIFFHDYSIIIIIIIIIIVGYILFISCINLNYNLNIFEGQELEIIWTLLPAVFLLFIAFPSLRLLYLIEESELYDITIKVLGHQWYWSYEYRDFDLKLMESYIEVERDSLFRLLNVDNCLFIPRNVNVRVIVSGVDVIHSFTVPSLGIRADAIPGRLNQLFIIFNRVGIFFGQCSEICGANHRFIPIILIVLPCKRFLEI